MQHIEQMYGCKINMDLIAYFKILFKRNHHYQVMYWKLHKKAIFYKFLGLKQLVISRRLSKYCLLEYLSLSGTF